MSGMPPTTEWYIARDGVQHGPISDAEIRKFVELGHLRDSDLVWCAQFTDWKTGGQAFPHWFQPKPAAPPPAPVQAPVQAPAQVRAAAPVAAAVPAASPAVVPQPSTAAVQTGLRTQDDAAWAEAMRAVVDGAAPPQHAGSAQSRAGQNMAGPAMNPLGAAPHQMGPGATGGASIAAAGPAFDAPFNPPATRPSSATNAITGYLPEPQLSARPSHLPPPDDYPEGEEEAPGRSWIGVATAAIAVILIVGGLGWFGWQNRSLVSGASAIGSILSSTTTSSSSSGSGEHFRTAPYQVSGETKEQIDASLQKIAVWRYLKREFGDWYTERVGDLEQMRQKKLDDRAVTQFMVDVIVTLRRRNSLAALQASPDHLKSMSNAFVTNLKQLGSRDGATCYAFITHGESSPFMVELSKTPGFSETLQKQMIAVFEAIVDARASRKIHANTRRPDYDRLTSDLMARGWSQNDLATFSDPQKLSTTLPDKVCTLVQEWFVTQLAIKETDLQTRLLAESLKPLVGG